MRFFQKAVDYYKASFRPRILNDVSYVDKIRGMMDFFPTCFCLKASQHNTDRTTVKELEELEIYFKMKK